MHWARVSEFHFCFSFCFRNFTFNLCCLVGVRVIFNDFTLFTVERWLLFFFVFVWSVVRACQVAFGTRYCVIYFIPCECVLDVQAKFHFIPIRFFSLLFIEFSLLRHCFAICTCELSSNSEHIPSLGGFNFSAKWNFFLGFCS